ncbi:MAG: M56 family metallopeptidase [Bryobacteraceae bacterium]|jgi:TonB family protein
MDASLFLKDVVLYSLQVGVVVGLAAFVPAALRLRLPAAKLAYWHILLAVCLLAPLASPWKQRVADLGGVSVTTTVVSVVPASVPAPASAPRRFPFSLSQVALAVLAVGAAARLGLLAVGLVRLRGYRRRSRALAPAPSWSPEADLRVSPEVSSPVMFGLRKPVVLLPAGFPLLDARLQDAILAHECLHVRRRDWLFSVAEELVRAVFWFHPAIWWLLGEIQLAREQAVDRAAVEMTQQREEYVDALLAIAGAGPQMDLAPAPLFLRKWHLKYRVISLVEKEVRMSKTVLASALAVGVCILAAACWMATSAFPLQAAPQVVTDGPGVSVDLGGTSLLHRMPVTYPEAARMKGIEGTVVVQARLDTSGNVVDASVVSGPQELRRTALEAVLQWHFAHAYGGSAQQVSIEFKLPKAAADAAGSSAPNVVRTGQFAGSSESIVVHLSNGADPAQVQALIQEMRQRVSATAQATPQGTFEAALESIDRLEANARAQATPQGTARGGVLGSIVETAPKVGGGVTGPAQPPQIRSIRVVGLPESAQNELLASLPVREGDMLTPENRAKLMAAARQFDEHLSLSSTVDSSGQADVQIVAPGAVPTRIRVGGAVQTARLVKNVAPVYPPLAKQARIQGTVVMDVVIAKDGTVQNVTVVNGHALLIQAAMDAVRQWQYHPTMLNGEPVEVNTQVEVQFALPDSPPQP